MALASVEACVRVCLLGLSCVGPLCGSRKAAISRVQVVGRSVSSGMDTVYALDTNENKERKRKMGIR